MSAIQTAKAQAAKSTKLAKVQKRLGEIIAELAALDDGAATPYPTFDARLEIARAIESLERLRLEDL